MNDQIMLLMRRIQSIVEPHSRQAFMWNIRPHGRVLDVGCGNNSPKKVKTTRPDVEYWGIDVGDYNNEQGKNYADHYIISSPEEFAKTLQDLPVKFDAIISSHNMEHCNQPKETMEAILGKLKEGGRLYLAFPSENTVGFPSRAGTLNFYDDGTHIYMPKYADVLKLLRKHGINIMFARKQYRPFLLATLGGVMEPLSRRKRKVLLGTWAYWGFESRIWGQKKSN